MDEFRFTLKQFCVSAVFVFYYLMPALGLT